MMQRGATTVQLTTALLLALVSSQSFKDKYGPPSISMIIGEIPMSAGSTYEMQCHVLGWEPPTNITWWLANEQLLNITEQVFLQGYDTISKLLLYPKESDNGKRVKCRAENPENVMEDSVVLIVHYKPVCEGKTIEYGVAKQETLRLLCKVRALPRPHTFRWTLINTSKMGNTTMVWRGNSSQHYHTPFSNTDYGSFYCWGRNIVGVQQRPCHFRVVPPRKIKPPYNCVVRKHRSQSVRVECKAPDNGKFRQTFQLEVFDASTDRWLYRWRRSRPVFLVVGLIPEQRLRLLISAINMKGRSTPEVLNITTLRAPGSK